MAAVLLQICRLKLEMIDTKFARWYIQGLWRHGWFRLYLAGGIGV